MNFKREIEVSVVFLPHKSEKEMWAADKLQEPEDVRRPALMRSIREVDKVL